MFWLLLILSLPTENATARMRAWRSLKASGAAVLRDGVYLLPDQGDCRATLDAVAAAVREGGGSAHVMLTQDEPAAPAGRYASLFDRSAEYSALMAQAQPVRAGLSAASASDALKRSRKLRRLHDAIVATDFFPAEAQRQCDEALTELEALAWRALSPHEPHAALADAAALAPLRCADFQGRRWATRARPWVDRLASAWLIRRHIDPQARLVWFAPPAAAPRGAIGFDFDGAAFSHVGARVTFEVLLARFALETPALLRLGAIVHHLDAGGVQPPEAAGVERVLAGLQVALADDDALFLAAAAVFEGLWVAFSQESSP